VSKLTKKEISSILLVYYSIDAPQASSTKKCEFVKTLEATIEKNGSPINRNAQVSLQTPPSHSDEEDSETGSVDDIAHQNGGPQPL
jgi:hypothetical protein